MVAPIIRSRRQFPCCLLLLATALFTTLPVRAQEVPGAVQTFPAAPDQTPAPTAKPKHFIGTSLFVLSSFIPGIQSMFAELDYGYRLSGTDVLLLGVDAWEYSSPMANPWSSGESYPGSVLSYGAIAGYQRFIWEGLFATLLTNALGMDYSDSQGRKLGTGFQLICSARMGYHVEFSILGQTFYLEPAAEFNWWPINLGVPSSFAEVENRYPNFVFSPGLNFGILF